MVHAKTSYKSTVAIMTKNDVFFPFMAKVLILYPLKIPESQRFSGVFKGYKMGALARNELKVSEKAIFSCSSK